MSKDHPKPLGPVQSVPRPDDRTSGLPADIKSRLDTITSTNGYAVFPSRVVITREPNGEHYANNRTVAIYQDTETCCGVFVYADEPSGMSLQNSIYGLLKDSYNISEPAIGTPLLIETTNTKADDATT